MTTTPPTTTPLATGTEKLLVDVDDGVAVVTFDNPAKRNALSHEVRVALPPLLAALEAEDAVRVVVLRGGGTEAFVSGADISEFAQRRSRPEDRASYDQLSEEIDAAWQGLEKPVVAMIQGWCMGGGLLVALEADLRVAAADATFAIPAARLGAAYPPTGVRGLVDLVGPGWASEILLTGRRLSAPEALSIGLVNRVVPRDELAGSVMALARALVDNAPLTLRASKIAIREARRDGRAAGLARVQAAVEACFASADYREGRQAFQEKRAPRFRGR